MTAAPACSASRAATPSSAAASRRLFAVASLDAIESDIRTDTGRRRSGNGSRRRASFDSLRVLRGGRTTRCRTICAGADRAGINTASFRLSQGLRSLRRHASGDPQAGRAGSRTDFFKFNAEISRSQMLFQPCDDASVSLFGLVAGPGQQQTSCRPAEKFFLGGIRYNRGFYAGEVTGDNALTAIVELQLNTPLRRVGHSATPRHHRPQLYVFHDWGETWENQQQDANHRLRSYGGGLRAQITPATWRSRSRACTGITRQPQGATGAVSPLKADAVYWRVLTRF